MKQTKTVIGIVVALVLVLALLNPGWLPGGLSGQVRELESTHFLIRGSGEVTLARVVTLLAALCFTWLCYLLLKLILSLIGRGSDRRRTLTELLKGLLKYVAVILAIVWGLSILGVNTAAVLAGVGIIGLILGFGAQSLIEDIITGVFIIFEGQYAIGDIIVLDDFRGIVRSIGVRTTVIEDAGGNLKIVNNSDIRNLQNRSRCDSKAICDVSVSYGTDLRRLEAVAAEGLPPMLEAHRDLYLGEPEYLGVTKLADSGVELRFVVPVREQDVFIAQRQLLRDIKLLFDDKGIEIPFPQVVVHTPGSSA